jgi:DNA-binding MarR family transcriptional regulator
MHNGNVVAAWIVSAQDRLREGMQHAELDPRELAALTLVASHDGCPMDWLRARIGLTQSGTVRLVDRLAGQDLLRRGPSAGRGVPLHVTGRGRQRLDRWRQVRDQVVEDLFAGVPAGQRQALVDSMALALTARERARPEADATCRTCSWADCGGDCPVDHSVRPADMNP